MKAMLLAWVAVLIGSPALADTCHRYGAIVALSGKFAPAVVAASVTGHDSPQGLPGRTSDLLILDVPLCVSASPSSPGESAALNVQLLCPLLVAGSGEAIEVTGRLIGAHTGNGHTPILLSCTE
jgi:hypothetical protein